MTTRLRADNLYTASIITTIFGYISTTIALDVVSGPIRFLICPGLSNLLQDSLQDLKSDYSTYEDIAFAKIKEGCLLAASHPLITTGAVFLKRTRQFFYYNTMRLLFSEETLLSRADAKVKQLRQSIDLLKAESEKLEVHNHIIASVVLKAEPIHYQCVTRTRRPFISAIGPNVADSSKLEVGIIEPISPAVLSPSNLSSRPIHGGVVLKQASWLPGFAANDLKDHWKRGSPRCSSSSVHGQRRIWSGEKTNRWNKKWLNEGSIKWTTTAMADRVAEAVVVSFWNLKVVKMVAKRGAKWVRVREWNGRGGGGSIPLAVGIGAVAGGGKGTICRLFGVANRGGAHGTCVREATRKKAMQAEEDVVRGRTKLRQAGKQIQSVINSAYKIERQARGLKDVLRDLPSRESARFRTQVNNVAKEAKKERNALSKEVTRISNHGISV
ncbi:hypothetical protein Sango_1579600 [Sesamum angolense]|uniref:Uncharacterized protein n=1 Tax=Sesamum angolense TaxID=2727404 RepID=A0AAE2BTW7_9LAMI|nr:hypothetical protein Sango_1579600 [Sesamum angolense]